ncbi:hypothetical protein BDZ89DRAFT_1132070 [Hymenopellis radicata]|nr:hypothetical protein BDZ89DRAFT_1132070 [Hymenopellis radicata]
MSTLPDTRTPLKEKRKTVGSLPYEHRSSPSFSKSGILPSPHHPPTVPLPATPSVTPPLTPLPAVPVPPDPPTITKRTRPRAHTLSSVSSRSSPSLPDPPPRTKSIHSEKSPGKDEALDIDAASPEVLRRTLRVRNQQLDDLTASMIRASQAHQAEKHALEKKIAALERETARREKEIQGLVWLVNNGKSANGTINAASKPTPTIDVSRVDSISTPSSSSSIKSPVLRRIHSDYDEESAASSGGESVASTQTTRAKRSSRMAVKTDVRRRSSLRHSPVPHGPDLPLPEVPRLEKKSSVSSLASSAASSQSSLLLHNNPSTSTLSAIPEGPPPVPKIPSSSPKPHSSSLRDPAILAAINARRDKEHKMKASSLKTPPKATPAPTPAAAYAANLKKGLPPTIDSMIHGALQKLDSAEHTISLDFYGML